MKTGPTEMQDKLLIGAAFVLSGVFIYAALIALFYIYQQNIVIRPGVNNLCRFLTNKSGLLDLYTLGCLLITSACFLAQLFFTGIKYNNIIQTFFHKIAFSIYSYIERLAKLILYFTQYKNIHTSLVFGICYLFISFAGMLIAIYYILPLEEKHHYLWALIVTPMISATVGCGIGYTISNFTNHLETYFPKNIKNPENIIMEVCKFLAIVVAGMLIMAMPVITKLLAGE